MSATSKQFLALFLACGGLNVCPAHAQPKHPLSWDKKPVLHVMPDSLKKYPAVFILEDRETEMQRGDEEMELYYTVHYIIRLNDDKGAEYFNTFNIPIPVGSKMTEIKARTILPADKVMEVDREKIKKVKSESGAPEYRIAMEGIEPGAEVEVFYTIKHPPTAAGSDMYSWKVPVQKAVFRLIVPDNMLYDVKGYNGYGTFKDSLMDDQRSYYGVSYNLPALEEEAYSLYKSSLKRVDYKLSYITRAGVDTLRRLSWKDMATELHGRYENFSSSELRSARDLLDQIGVSKQDSELNKVLLIEDYFKSKITITNNLPEEEVSDFDVILRKKLSTERGYVHFFAACLRAAEVEYRIGMTGSRYGYPMDEKLEMWSHLDEYCFYLPKLKGYLTPASFNYRYPFIPFGFCGSKAVFTTKSNGSDAGKVSPDIRVIPFPGMNQNGIAITASVHFEPKEMLPIVNTTFSFNGYSGGSLREGLQAMPKEKEAEFVNNLIGLTDRVSDLKSYQVSNRSFNAYSTGLPLKVSAEVQSPRLIEKAGTRYLFRVGDLIGKQSELYDEEKRSLPIELEYPHQFPHTLRVEIPQGYKIANPEVIRSHVVCQYDGKEACGFNSDYTMEGNTMVISVKEFYSQTSLPISSYSSFRKVINAAADFNKLSLVFQKI